MLADSNPLVLTAMSEIFDRDPRFSLIATAATAEGFLGTVMRLPVRIGVIDWNLPAIGGAKLIEVLRAQETAPRLVVYGHGATDLPRLAMAAGAAGYAPRSSPVESLLDTCVDVAAGKMVFGVPEFLVTHESELLAALTPPREVLGPRPGRAVILEWTVAEGSPHPS